MIQDSTVGLRSALGVPVLCCKVDKLGLFRPQAILILA